MKRLILVLAALFFLPLPVFAQSSTTPEAYVITDFKSEIKLEKDTKLRVTETIRVNFPDSRHGIYRVIPTTYSSKGQTINANLKVISIADENGNPYKYETSRLRQSVKLKIGDADKTVAGLNTYIISYNVSKVVQRFEDHEEIYWNVTGHEWDTDILQASSVVDSPYARITKVECFAGEFGTNQKNCKASSVENTATFSGTSVLGYGEDFTIVVAFNRQNDLVFPGKFEVFWQKLLDNSAYLLALGPLIALFFFWMKKGRDKKYAGDNVYYVPDKKEVVTKPLFAREHLPMVYSPIAGLTPSQVGTIVDEKVDIQDVVAEIIELARLGYLRIKKIETKKLIGKKIDYEFVKLDKAKPDLTDYQKFLLEKLFSEKESKVLLSSLKNNFYKHLNAFKEKLYNNLAQSNIFDGNPDKVRKKWFGIAIILWIGGLLLTSVVNSLTGNVGPMALFYFSALPGIFLIKSMPRKSAWGYSLFRQAKGLAYYLKVGKWRHEINEKHLFLEEVLPLAISLGVVDQLANDMQGLGVTPPSYFEGFVAGNLSSDIRNFSRSTSGSLMSAPGGNWSGSSSWSGGSGFGGGGSSGGGFGGGGGGSW